MQIKTELFTTESAESAKRTYEELTQKIKDEEEEKIENLLEGKLYDNPTEHDQRRSIKNNRKSSGDSK